MGGRLHDLRFTAAATALAMLTIGQPARAELLQFGTNFTTAGTNSPNSFSETDVLTAGTSSIDGGALSLTVTTIPEGAGAEWVVLAFQTATGGTIAGNITQDWSLQAESIRITQPVLLTHFFLDFGTNGSLVSPTSDANSNLPLETNPITGSGTVFGEGFNLLETTFVGGHGLENPFDILAGNGFNPSALNEWEEAFLISPASVPEPASLTLLGTALAGLGLIRRRRKRG